MPKLEVTLIDATGYAASDPSTYAARLLIYTKNTRLEFGAETMRKVQAMSPEEIAKELDYISKTIRSSWEFCDYTFEIKNVTRAFTHQFVRTRTASYAQQAQRVVDMSDFAALMPQTVIDAGKDGMWGTTMDMLRNAYSILRKAGVPAQDARGLLPTNAYTNIIAKMNLRTFADLVGKRDNLRAQDEYGQVIKAMQTLVLGIHPWVGPFIKPERTATPNIDAILRELLGTASPVDQPRINGALKELDALKGTWG